MRPAGEEARSVVAGGGGEAQREKGGRKLSQPRDKGRARPTGAKVQKTGVRGRGGGRGRGEPATRS